MKYLIIFIEWEKKIQSKEKIINKISIVFMINEINNDTYNNV